MMDHMVKALNLTPEQKTKWDGILAKHKPAQEARRKAAMEADKALRDAMKKPDAKPEELKALHRAAADARFDAQLEHRAQRQELRDLLTPEQREKAAFILGRMEGGRRGHGWGQGGGHPEGGMR
jgi:Spy/CpxP family protein refolding chaperone